MYAFTYYVQVRRKVKKCRRREGGAVIIECHICNKESFASIGAENWGVPTHTAKSRIYAGKGTTRGFSEKAPVRNDFFVFVLGSYESLKQLEE